MSQWVGAVVLAAAAVLAGVVFGGRSPAPAAVEFLPAPAAESLTVHVTGAVIMPGLVQVAPGSRVAAAVAAAGGVTSQASLFGVNLAAPVRDGEQIRVPVADDRDPGGGIMSVSSASVEELTALPGLGPVLAQRIVQHRDANGPFSALEDLLSVPGIGESKLAALRDLVVP